MPGATETEFFERAAAKPGLTDGRSRGE